MKSIRYLLEYLALRLAFLVFSLLSPRAASNLGAWIVGTIGPLLGASGKARSNIERALPDASPQDVSKILKEMWQNLGAVLGEYPHLQTIVENHTHIENSHIMEDALRTHQRCVFFSAHMANWEVTGPSALPYTGTIRLLFREPNNPMTASLLDKARFYDARLSGAPKTRQGVASLVEGLKENTSIGMLIDQKYNEGLPIPFFGQPAMTSPAFVQLAQKYDCPLIPVQVVRTGPAHFKIIVHPSLKTMDENGKALATELVIGQAHAYLEEWIKQHPGQWLWLHRRWG